MVWVLSAMDGWIIRTSLGRGNVLSLHLHCDGTPGARTPIPCMGNFVVMSLMVEMLRPEEHATPTQVDSTAAQDHSNQYDEDCFYNGYIWIQ